VNECNRNADTAWHFAAQFAFMILLALPWRWTFLIWAMLQATLLAVLQTILQAVLLD